MLDQERRRVVGIVLASGIATVALVHYWDLVPPPLQNAVLQVLPEPNPIFGAVWSWVRGTSSAAPDPKPVRLQHCINVNVSSYGNMRDREDKHLEYLRAHKEDVARAWEEESGRWDEIIEMVNSMNVADPKFIEGFRWTFATGHAAGCLEYEKQLATQAASASDVALFDSCIDANLALQTWAALKELPDFEMKQRRMHGDPVFFSGVLLGVQRGHVSGCLLADALKRSGYYPYSGPNAATPAPRLAVATTSVAK